MKNFKTIFVSLFLIVIHQINLSAAEVGSKHEYGLSFLGSYDYEEPKLMHLRSGFQAADDELENIRFLYNYKSEHDVVPGTNNAGTTMMDMILIMVLV